MMLRLGELVRADSSFWSQPYDTSQSELRLGPLTTASFDFEFCAIMRLSGFIIVMLSKSTQEQQEDGLPESHRGPDCANVNFEPQQ